MTTAQRARDALPGVGTALRAARDLELLRRLPRTGCSLRYASCVDRFVAAPKTLARKAPTSTCPRPQAAWRPFSGCPSLATGDAPSTRTRPACPSSPAAPPIEHIVSWYSFLQTGEDQKHYEARQRHFCVNDTGKAFDTPCVPRLTPFEFASSGEHSVYEHGYLMSNHADDNAWDKHHRADPIGTDANFMTEWLKPHANSTLEDVQRLLLDKFVLVGVSDQLAAFEQRVFGRDEAACQTIAAEAQHPVKATSHGTVEDLFSEEE